jgi:gliding motility-associated-like protein
MSLFRATSSAYPRPMHIIAIRIKEFQTFMSIQTRYLLLILLVAYVASPFYSRGQSPTCDIAQITATFTGAGYVPLAVQGQPCSMYFVNPASQSAGAAQAAAAALGANLVVMNDAAENAAVAAALAASPYNGNTIWIGYQRVGAGQNLWYASDGTTGNFAPNNSDPNIYQNWAGGEPNNSGYQNTGTFGSCDYQCTNGEQCVQIYSNSQWNDLACDDNSRSVIEVNLCPEITITLSTNNVCAGTPVTLSATTVLGSTPYSYTWDTGQTGASIPVTPAQTTAYTATVTDRYSCSASEAATVTTLSSATSTFTADANACVNVPAAVTYIGSGLQGSTYAWNFDGGVPVNGSGQGPYQVGWATPGVKNVTLQVTENGCVSTMTTVQVNVEANPVADFTFTTECEGTATTFTNTSTGNFAVSAWDFGSGPVLANNTTFTFASSGTFPVSLGVTTANGCFGTATQQVTVHPQPAAAFTAPDVCLGASTTFADGTTIGGSGSISTHAWDFGDGVGTSAQSDPTYTYTAANSYNVSLTVTSVQGCTDNVTQAVIVGVNPVADFTVLNACAGSAVEFLDASTVAAGNLTGWSWTFGDNSTSSLQDPMHTYAAAGTYTVTLTASSGSCTDVFTGQAVVYPNPIANFTTSNVCLGDVATFTDNSSVNGSTITQWAWNFGGAGNSVLQSPTFTFANPGTYTVTLGVITADFCSATFSQPITIHPLPVPAFTAPPVCLGAATTFTNQSTVASGLIVGSAWDFGDLTGTSTATSPTYNYTAAGTYPVTLGTVTAFGCLAITTQNVTVNPLPVITASHTDILCAGQTNGTATASGSGSAAPYGYLWDNALQSTTATIQNLGPGPYTVTVTDALGCVSDTTVLVQQPLPINVNMIAGDDTCGLGNGAIQAVMLGGTAPFVYVWSAIRDSLSISSTLVPPSGWNRGLTPGEYSVTVTDAGGCQTQGTVTVGEIPKPVAVFSTRSKPEEMNDPSVQFFNQSEAALTYEWHFGDGEVSSQEHPNHDYDSSGVYLVMLIARNEPRYGCTDTAFRYVEVDPLYTFYIPNAFTPDGDGINDSWGPSGANFEVESYNVQVYDRWGKLVWQTDNPERQWNGRDQGSLEPVRPGLYAYQFIVKQFNTFEPKRISGTVTLYRNR